MVSASTPTLRWRCGRARIVANAARTLVASVLVTFPRLGRLGAIQSALAARCGDGAAARDAGSIVGVLPQESRNEDIDLRFTFHPAMLHTFHAFEDRRSLACGLVAKVGESLGEVEEHGRTGPDIEDGVRVLRGPRRVGLALLAERVDHLPADERPAIWVRLVDLEERVPCLGLGGSHGWGGDGQASTFRRSSVTRDRSRTPSWCARSTRSLSLIHI